MSFSRPRRRTAGQRVGDVAESLVADRLEAAGWHVLARNMRLGRKEIDLLAVDPGPPVTIVVVEVRWRRRRDFGLPEETFNWRKRRHLRAAVGHLLEAGALPDGRRLPVAPVRIDLVVVEPGGADRPGFVVRHHRNAI